MPKSSSRRLEIPVGLTCLIQLGTRVQGENHVDYRYEYYAEDNHRMTIETHSVYFEQKLMDTLIAKGELVYDGISGATPTGAPSASLTTVADIRRAMNLQFEGRLANHTLTPGFAYSKEHDYQSYGISLNDAIDFNDKNTILQLGVAHNFDSVRRADEVTWTGKDSTEVLVGVSQLLSPKTTLTANFTFGNDSGYLSDPYRLAQFTTFGFAFNENRPGHKNKEVVLLSLTRYLEPLNASLEVSYRFHHDSFDVDSHTLGLTWHQWLGKHLMVEPMFRCYRQSAASFYAPKFAGVVPGGGYFSADYRLSELYTLDFGLQATVLITDWLKVTAGYHRYEMRGLDNLTASAMYPQANIFTAGLSFFMVMTSPSSAQEAIARVTQSARTSVDRGLHKLEFRAMSTVCLVNCHGVAAEVARDFQREVVAWTGQFEARYSRFIPDSLIGRINAAAGEHWVETDPETDRLLGLCHELFFFTRGSFDPTALPLIKLWNWKAKPPVLPDDAAIRTTLELVGWKKVQRKPGGIFLPQRGMALDLGGVGKEYAVDCVMNLASQRGIPHVLVDFGQDVRVRGQALDKKFWWIGLDDATNPGKCWAGVAVTDHAVATSGDYLRNFTVNGRRYGHILDPRTGYPAFNDCRAVSIIAPSCTIAGLLSTSVCILGAKEGLALVELHPGAAGAVTTDSGKLYSRKFHEYIPA